jgi:hypothetical protein
MSVWPLANRLGASSKKRSLVASMSINNKRIMRTSYALCIVDTLIRSIYPALLSTTMKYSTQSSESSLEKNLDRD